MYKRRYIIMPCSWLLFLFCATGLYAQDMEESASESAQDMSAEQLAYMEQAKKIWDTLERQTGVITLPGNFATLDVPKDYYFLNAKDTETVLVDIWGNPPGGETLGMLLPAGQTPFDDDSWAVTFEYVEDGYVSDEDAAEINYTKLLKQMKKDIRASSKQREQAGYGTVELMGWAEPPFYSHDDKHLYWAKELKFNGGQATLNYEIRSLGRKGVLSMTFIASTDQLAEINGAREDVLEMAAFNEGYRYQDYEPGNDKLAAYGVGALVAGAVAKKTGLLVAAIVLLKKFWIFLLLGVGAFFGKIKKLFSGDKNDAS